jgi:flavin-dependent trigonelline monooxygenase, reductase component
LVNDESGGLTLPEKAAKDNGASATLRGLFDAVGVEAQPSFLYSVFDDSDRKRQHICFLCQTDAHTPQQGEFVPLTEETLAKVGDPAIVTMLRRFAAEAQLGTYGIYYGDTKSGEVRPISHGRQ